MSDRKKALYVGNFIFPDGNAAAHRVVSNGRVLRELGYDVVFIGVDPKIKRGSNIVNTEITYDGFKGYSLPYPVGIKGWLSYNYQFKMVTDFIDKEVDNLDLIVIYGCPTLSLFGNLLRKWSRKKHITFLTDAVDWLPATVGNLGYRAAKYLDTVYQKSYLNAKADGVIAVSRYLNDYYQKKGCKTVVIPPLTDCNTFQFISNSSPVVSFVYVGMPFALNAKNTKPETYKDRLDIVLECFGEMDKRGVDFELKIYGISKDQYLSVVTSHESLIQKLADKIHFFGSVPHSVAKNEISRSDFSIFFRDVNRGTTAGFPTKFGESISCGTPVITTNTSDLQNYLTEGENGFLVDITDKEKMIDKMMQIILMDKSRILQMKEKCYNSRLFDYHNYVEKMKQFLLKIAQK